MDSQVEIQNSDSAIQSGSDRFCRGFRHFIPSLFLLVSFLAVKTLGKNFPFSDCIAVVSAAAATLLIVAQRLPLQNVLGLLITITIFSGAILLVEILVGTVIPIPFLNHKFLQLPTWTTPLLWIIALVNGRGMAKLFLHKFQTTNNFGLWVLALSSVLVAGMGLENFVPLFVLALFAFVVTTPWFLDKKPVKRAPDYQPLLITLVVLLC